MNFAVTPLTTTNSYTLYDSSCAAPSGSGNGIFFPLKLRSDVDGTEFYWTLKLANFNNSAATFSIGAIDFNTNF